MMDLLLAIGWNNLLVSGLLAVMAWLTQRDGRLPFLAHLMWLLVLAKLLTPPLWNIGMVDMPWVTAEQVAIEQEVSSLLASLESLDATGSEAALKEASILPAGAAGSVMEEAQVGDGLPLWKSLLLSLWAAGSLLVLGLSFLRMLRFHRLLAWGTQPAPPRIQEQMDALVSEIGLRRAPHVLVSQARLAPLVWAFFGRPRLVLPAHLLTDLKADQLRWVLAHELMHLHRRDHLVRWLEWSACVAFWWNPVAWWARRNLRNHEEICCDAQVLRMQGAEPRAYAASLWKVAASLAPPDVRPPAVASAFTNGGELERRFRMILSKNSLTRASKRLQALVLVGAVALLPFGIAMAQEPDYGAIKHRLSAAVEAGEIGDAQAEAMLAALKKKASANKDAVQRRLKEAIAAGEITSGQAEAMMATLEPKRRNTQGPLRGGARVTYSFDYTTDASEEAIQLAKLDAERKPLEEKLAKLDVQQQEYWAEAKKRKESLAQVERELELLVNHGRLTEMEAQLRKAQQEEALWPKEEENRKTFEYLQLQERMQQLEQRAKQLDQLKLPLKKVEPLEPLEPMGSRR